MIIGCLAVGLGVLGGLSLGLGAGLWWWVGPTGPVLALTGVGVFTLAALGVFAALLWLHTEPGVSVHPDSDRVA